MRFLFAIAAGLLATGSAFARDCRPPTDAPPGVHVPPAPGCPPAGLVKGDRAKAAAVERLQPGRDPGFIDLGNGTTVRVSGRVRVETAIGR